VEGSTGNVISKQTLSTTGKKIKVESNLQKKRFLHLVVKSYYQLPSAFWLKSQLPNLMFQWNLLFVKSCATPSLAKIPQHY